MDNITDNLRFIAKKGLGVPIFLFLLLTMMILPIPSFLLDLLFTFNIAFSLLVLLAGVYSLRPLDFAAFPTVLLLATLLRLALNVASTRVVLLNGSNGSDAAGQVIKAFGEVVIGGNYAVGIIVFAIFIIINFVVITKGSGRISEVSARFTLDAMPGKQMSIDADLNAGVITQEEAKLRRQEVAQEADFYGAMDGASKFVRGDAIAGILILIINMIGGSIIGMMQHDMSFKDAVEVYAILTIGDGLVAQIPALILSTAAAIIVTRVSRAEDMSAQVYAQVFSAEKPLIISATIMLLLGLIPGMPHTAFIGLALLIYGVVWAFKRKKQVIEASAAIIEQAKQKEVAAKSEVQEGKELSWEDVPQVDLISLEIGYRLIPLVDKTQSGELLSRIKGVRKKLSSELGFLVPPVHIKDNLDLLPNGYRIGVCGVWLGEFQVVIEKDLAINPGQVYGTLDGTPTKDPAFGLDAIWIEKSNREYAQSMGYTVVDASTVIATHLSQIVQNYAHQLLGHEEVQKMLDLLAKSSPKLVEDLVAKLLPLNSVVKVCQNLLLEKIPLRDIRTIAETLTDSAHKSQDIVYLTSQVRIALGPMIVQRISNNKEELAVTTLHPSLEQILQKSVQSGNDDAMLIEPNLANQLQKNIKQAANKQELAGNVPILVVPQLIRKMVAQFVRAIHPNMMVLAFAEIPHDKQLKIVATIGET